MAEWSIVAAGYGIVLAAVAALQAPARGWRTFGAAAIYAVTAGGSGALAGASLHAHLWMPAVLLVTGYWLSGLFFRRPDPRLEAWLLGVDRALHAPHWAASLPGWANGLLELVYGSVYALVAAGALLAAVLGGADAVAHYWSVVLAAALASYVAIPWLPSRPPRQLEKQEGRDHRLRHGNLWVLDRLSIQANTLPSGHVSAAVAAALGVLPVAPAAGQGLLAVAAAVAVAAVAGRYHYVVDCAAGVVVALAAWSVM